MHSMNIIKLKLLRNMIINCGEIINLYQPYENHYRQYRQLDSQSGFLSREFNVSVGRK